MKLIHNKKMMSKILKKNKPANLNPRQYYEARNSVLILRRNGGLGDIMAHRMIFEDFKRINPDAHIVFACPQKFHQCVEDHPFIDELKDSACIDTSQYMLTYDTSNACMRYEISMAPFSGKNRSDIWANHCGVELENHNMHLHADEKEVAEVKKILNELNTDNLPTVLFTPVSAMFNKNLKPKQIAVVVEHLRERGLFVYGSHTTVVPGFESLNVPTLRGNIRRLIAVVDAADCLVTVDTAAMHIGGGLGKHMTAIFTFTDGKVYAKYYPNCVLVQKHRDNGDWDCGPCYNWADCPKTKGHPKPCLTEITSQMLTDGIDTMLGNIK